MKLETDRLKLREFKQADAEVLAKLLDNKEVSKNIAMIPHPYDLEDAKEFIKDCEKKARQNPRPRYNFVIESRDQGNFLGSISLDKSKKDKQVAELGYWLAEKYWQNGYMSEAVERILKFGFEKLDLRRIEAGVYPNNIASISILEKYNFKREGVKRKAQRTEATGRIHDVIMYGRLSENFNSQAK
ncbi:MAG: GNAT family N-acetyltransferase [Candidatus Paceibacteria bacterium]